MFSRMKWSIRHLLAMKTANPTRFRVVFILIFLLPPLSILAQDDTAVTHIRVGHFSLDAGAVDIYMDGTLYAENVALGSLLDWRMLPAGRHTVAITRTGSTLETPMLVPAEVDFLPEGWQTLALIGRRTDGTLRLHLLVEDYTPIQRGNTRLSIFHALINNPPLNVQANDTEIIRLLGYPGTLRGDSDGLVTVNIIPNTYDLVFTLDDGTLLFDIRGINLGAGQHYFIGLTGTIDHVLTVIVGTDPAAPESASDVPPTVTDNTELPPATETPSPEVTPDTPAAVPTETAAPTNIPAALPGDGRALLRIGHFAPGAPDFDIYLDDEQLTPAFYPTLTSYYAVDAGDYDLSVVIQGESLAKAVLSQPITLQPDSVVTIMAIGSLDTGTFAIQPIEEDYSPADRLETRLAVFNAIPDAQFINIVADDTLVLVQGLSFPGSFEGAGDGFISLDMIAGVYQLTVETSGFPLLTLSEIRMGEGRYYFLVAAGTTETAFFVLEAVNIADIQP